MLISIWNWTQICVIVSLWTLVVGFFFVLTAPFDRVRRITGRWFRRGGIAIITLNPLWKVHIRGYKVKKGEGPFVVVANHQSIADIPVISHLPWEMKWLSKESNFKLPVFGWMMRMAGDVPLRRGDSSSASSAMARCRWYLERGMSVMIFPEGTRSRDGSIGAFKDGAFRLALETGYPILPVAVSGTRYTIPKHSWVFGGKCNLTVEVLPPVDVKGWVPERLEDLKAHVRAEIVEHFLSHPTPLAPCLSFTPASDADAA